MAKQHVLTLNLRQMKWEMCDKRESNVIHTDEVGKWIRPHKSERMSLIFGFELRRQVHAKKPSCGPLKTTLNRWAWALTFDVTKRHTGFVHVVGRQFNCDFVTFDDTDAVQAHFAGGVCDQ
jgi:hypothetical protein